MKVDDLYVCNGAGTSNNDFLGDVAVYNLLPNGNGFYSQFVGSDADSTDNYLLVDEAGNPVTTDYAGSPTDGNKDTYTFQDLPVSSGTVLGTQVGMYAAKSDTLAKSIRSVARLSGVDATGTDHTLQTSYDIHDDIYETKPGGGAWTIADVNNTEFGAEARP